MIAHLLAIAAIAAYPAPPARLAKPAPIATPHTRDAPADEYFGPQKMSALEIRMRIGALGRRFHERSISDDDVLHDAQLIEQSLHAWATRYPGDRWIAPTSYHLAQLYMEVQTPAARNRTKTAFGFVITAAPATREAGLASARLHAGFPALHEETAVVATPTPSPLQTVAPAAASVAPSATATATSAPPSGAPAPQATRT